MIDSERFGPYRVVDRLGAGGAGVVYRAIHEALKRDVALKLIQSAALLEPGARERFQREARIAASLAHPNLVRVFDAGCEGDCDYIAMELVRGQTLNELLEERGRLEWPEVARLLCSIADALATLHAAGLVHRDLKPSNVMIAADGTVKVLDFGLARHVDRLTLTAPGTLVGTLKYMAPEVLLGEPARFPADVWGMGCLGHELLEGTRLVHRDTPAEILDLVLNVGVVPLPEHGARVPESLRDTLRTCLITTPSDRPTMAALRDACADAQRPQAPVAPPSPDPRAREEPAPVRPARPPRSAAPPAASRPGGWSLELVFGVMGLAIALTVFALARPRGEPVRPPIRLPLDARPSALPTAVTSAPSVDSFVPDAAFTTVSPELRACLPRLKSGGDTARRAVIELRRGGGVDLGPLPEMWLRWTHIAAWLEAGASGSLPLRGAQSADAADFAYRRLFMSDLSRAQHQASVRRASVILRALVESPSDPIAWLSLGRLLELEGRSAASFGVYREVLPLLTGEVIDQAPEFAWAGLASALIRLPGHTIEREWLDWIPEGKGSDRAWGGLRALLRIKRPELYERILRASAGRGDDSGQVELGAVLLERGDRAGALHAWEAALRSHPRLYSLSSRLVERLLPCGEIEPCRRMLSAGLLHADFEAVVQRLDPQSAGVRLPAPHGLALALELMERIAAGEWRQASARLGERGQALGVSTSARLAVILELYVHGDIDREGEALSALQNHGCWPCWYTAAGVLSAPAGRALFEKAMARASAQRGQDTDTLALARALWLARAGDPAKAAAELASVSLSAQRSAVLITLGELIVGALERKEPLPLLISHVMTPRDRAARAIEALAAKKIADALEALEHCMASDWDEPGWAILGARLLRLDDTRDAALRARFEIAVRYHARGAWSLPRR